MRVDSTAMHPEIVLAFDTAFSTSLGMPNLNAGLMQASNGLIYYMTQQNNWPMHTRIIALDPVTDSAWVAAELGTPAFPWRGQRQFSSMIEGEPGILIDVTADPFAPAKGFRFNTATNALSIMTTLPSGVDGSGYPIWTTFNRTLCKASDGRIYGGTTGVPLGSPVGAFASLTPATNSFSIIQNLLDPADGYPIRSTVQWGSKLYLTTEYGGTGWNTGINNGTIVSYDLDTHTYQKELDLPSSCSHPEAMIAHGDGKLYGEGQAYAPYSTSLFAYDPATNTVGTKFYYAELGTGVVWNPLMQRGLLSASNGKIYGSFDKGIFEYDPAADTLRLRAALQFVQNERIYPYGLTSPLIEVCRKPNYKPRPTTSFEVCAGSQFAYDLHNVNATGVVWRRNGEVVPTQTGQRLAFGAITTADAGTWACTLTNECGTTEPPAITITVQPGTFTASTIAGDTLLCGQGGSVVLTGNNGGTWSTGATTPTLTVTGPGTYYVNNTNACGTSMSNRLHVAHADSARLPPMVYWENVQYQGDTAYICPGQELTLTGNEGGPWGLYTPGVWSTGDTGPGITVQDTGMYYVSITNACNTDSLLVKHVLPVQAPPLPSITITDNPFGPPVDTYLCGHEALYLNTEDPNDFRIYNDLGQFISSFGGPPGWTQNFRIDSAGVYHVISYGCGPVDTLTITVYHADGPPTEAPAILPDVETLIGCDADTVYLSSAEELAYWSWYDGNFQYHVDTSATLLVDWNILGYNLTAFNGCGVGPSRLIWIQPEATPVVGYVQQDPLVCPGHAPITLTPGTPAGGTYSGAGVADNTFDPALAGVGTHAVTYSYGEGNCMAQATDSITVEVCTGVAGALGAGLIGIHPNPNTGEFTVEVGRNFTEGRLTLYDAQGQRIGAAVRLVPGPNAIVRHGLAPGVYQVRLEMDGTVLRQSVVVAQ